MRRPVAAILILLFAFSGIMAAARSEEGAEPSQVASFEVGQYVVAVYDEPDSWLSHFVIARAGEVLFHEEDARFWLGGIGCDWDERYSDVELGQDVTGNGVPNVAVTSYSGGAHCCFSLAIYELGETASLLQRINGAHTEPILVDLDDDGIYEIELRDWTFAYWRAPFVYSPAPRVVLSLQNNRYEVDTKHMAKPVPENLISLAKQVRTSPQWETFDPDGDEMLSAPPPQLWGVMLDLIYTGHAEKAWDFADVAWPDTMAGKEDFLAEFATLLEQGLLHKGVGNDSSCAPLPVRS